ncbi:chlorite dismutase family protein [Methylorubrum rhodinum]|uniref:chlorite dismutase family protein n=1 Tax=Methylorubrum rhodinum TaxID=29428 RepID=UPI003BB03497
MPSPLQIAFRAGATGAWRIERIAPVIGESLAPAERLAVTEGASEAEPGPLWSLRGTTSNTRYATRTEVRTLASRQEGLGRPTASRAALIPIRKTDTWWSLAQDERRVIFEEQSRHIRIGLDTLPGVARRLHHSRELGEPFDFLTWFEYAPEHADAFETMVARLRDTPEWRYVDREVDIRLIRADASEASGDPVTAP